MNLKTTTPEHLLIHEIASTAVKADKLYNLQELMIDIAATHLNGEPLDLEKMAKMEYIDTQHDIIGIQSNLNRDTGELQNCFLPRYRKTN
tara:strand:+ start:668 stop:937 length:270 start_codon:yes stop_codon:yes gene_type:complete